MALNSGTIYNHLPSLHPPTDFAQHHTPHITCCRREEQTKLHPLFSHVPKLQIVELLPTNWRTMTSCRKVQCKAAPDQLAKPCLQDTQAWVPRDHTSTQHQKDMLSMLTKTGESNIEPMSKRPQTILQKLKMRPNM